MIERSGSKICISVPKLLCVKFLCRGRGTNVGVNGPRVIEAVVFLVSVRCRTCVYPSVWRRVISDAMLSSSEGGSEGPLSGLVGICGCSTLRFLPSCTRRSKVPEKISEGRQELV